MVNRNFYEQKVQEWVKGRGEKGASGNYYLTKKAYLGESYIELVFSRMYQNRISIEQLAYYLGVKVKNVPRMEELLFTKGGGA
jgi:hypothetical protein